MLIDMDRLKDWHFEVDFENIAWAVFDRENETMNTLGERPLRELAAIVEACKQGAMKGDIRGLVFISAKENNFIAGADIRDFETFTTESKCQQAIKAGIDLFNAVEKLRIPVVAAIHGFCLGGGLEFALACDYRIADREEGTRLGFPEVKLGIFPGLNGTVRSIRQAGALDAMQIMLTGRMLRPAHARAIGLVDELVPTRHKLRWAARKAVLRKKRARGAVWWKRLFSKSPIRRILAKQMRKKTAEKVRQDHYPAPFKLIELFENFGGDLGRMAIAETRAFVPLMVSETARNLRRVFRLSEELKNQAPQGDFRPLKVHVIGAGTMGADIASWCVVCGMDVTLQDIEQAPIEKAIKGAHRLFKKRLKKSAAIDAAMARFRADVEGENVAQADVVIEAIIENLEVKRELFKALEKKMKPGAILATNTSSLLIEDIAALLQDPGRLIGIHFFNPVAQLPLVEVVRGANTRVTEVEKGCIFVKAIKKFPLIVKSCPGFLVNRVLAPYMVAAMECHQSGVAREKIDQAAVAFGMPMGPLELSDVVGLDICLHVADILDLGVGEDSELARMVKNNKLGKKTGEGLYVWENGKPQKRDVSFGEQELADLGRQLIEPMLKECQKCRDDKIVENADFVDAGVIFGTGFAPFLGGPLHYQKNLDNEQR